MTERPRRLDDPALAKRLVLAAGRGGYNSIDEIIATPDSELVVLRNVSATTVAAFRRVLATGDPRAELDLRRVFYAQQVEFARTWRHGPPPEDPKIRMLQRQPQPAVERPRATVESIASVDFDVARVLAEGLPAACPQPHVVRVPQQHPTAVLVWWRGGVRDSWVWAACDLLTAAGYTATPEAWPSVIFCRARGVDV